MSKFQLGHSGSFGTAAEGIGLHARSQWDSVKWYLWPHQILFLAQVFVHVCPIYMSFDLL